MKTRFIVTAALLMPLTASAENAPATTAPSAEPAAAASCTPAEPVAPASAEALKEAQAVLQRVRAFVDKLDTIAGSEQTSEEKAAAVLACKAEAAELGRALRAVEGQALDEAYEAYGQENQEGENRYPALDAAMSDPVFCVALENLREAMHSGVDDGASVDPVLANQAGEYMMHYFQNPEPDKINDLITLLARAYPSPPEFPAAQIFFGEVFKANPDRVEHWMETAKRQPQAWQQILEQAWLYAKGELPDITSTQPATPGILDGCWGGFSASGDKKYPEYVLEVACRENPPQSIDGIIYAAVWSYSSFVLEFPELRDIARTWFASASERQKMNFARRAAENVQMAVFDKVLSSNEEIPDAGEDDLTDGEDPVKEDGEVAPSVPSPAE